MRSHRKRDYGRRLKIWLNVDADVILFCERRFPARRNPPSAGPRGISPKSFRARKTAVPRASGA
jgi:hypothetical protein